MKTRRKRAVAPQKTPKTDKTGVSPLMRPYIKFSLIKLFENLRASRRSNEKLNSCSLAEHKQAILLPNRSSNRRSRTLKIQKKRIYTGENSRNNANRNFVGVNNRILTDFVGVVPVGSRSSARTALLKYEFIVFIEL